MKDIVIKKTSDESQRIVLQTDSETLDYQSRFLRKWPDFLV